MMNYISPPEPEKTTMKKLLTTLALALGLILGGTVTLAAPANADGPDGPVVCQPDDPNCEQPAPPCETTDPNCANPVPPCNPATSPNGCPDPNGRATTDQTVANLWARVTTAEQTANDYRVQVAALKAKVDRLQRVADRRAATIQRLRAVIRSLR